MTVGVKNALLEAANLIRKGWAQGFFARDARGKMVHFNDPKACSWCLTGALNRATWATPRANHDALLLCDRAVNTLGYKNIVYWNDAPGRTQNEVVALLEHVAEGLS